MTINAQDHQQLAAAAVAAAAAEAAIADVAAVDSEVVRERAKTAAAQVAAAAAPPPVSDLPPFLIKKRDLCKAIHTRQIPAIEVAIRAVRDDFMHGGSKWQEVAQPGKKTYYCTPPPPPTVISHLRLPQLHPD